MRLYTGFRIIRLVLIDLPVRYLEGFVSISLMRNEATNSYGNGDFT